MALMYKNKKEDIWSKVTNYGDPDMCWDWTGCLDRDGYGQFRVHNKPIRVHRIAFSLAKGDIPKGMCVLHKCDNPKCCNPDHLWLGTAADNNRDRAKKGRSYRCPKEKHWTHLYPDKVPKGDEHWSRRIPQKINRGDAHWSRRYPEKVSRGEKNGQTVLSTTDVIEIRKLRKSGLTLVKIAEKFNISFQHVSRLVNNQCWKAVGESR